MSVSSTNYAPSAINDTYTVNEDSILTLNPSQSVLHNDDDANQDRLSAVLLSPPTNPLFKSYANGTFTFDASNYDLLGVGDSLIETFTYQAYDGQAYSNVATVSITIHGVNDDPTANNDIAGTSASSPVSIDVLDNDTDVDQYEGHYDTLTIVGLNDLADTGTPADSSGSQPGGGLLITTGAGSSVELVDGQLVYTPDANFFGVDTFQYTISDGHGGSATATVSVTVNPANQGPLAVNDQYTANEDTTLTVTADTGALLNDSDPNTEVLGAQLLSGPSKGILEDFNSDGSFVYNPNGEFESLGANQSENVTFTYQAIDGSGARQSATVTIQIDGVNDAPVAVDNTYTAIEGVLLTGKNIVTDDDNGPAAGGVDHDVDSSTLTVVSINGTAFATLDDRSGGFVDWKVVTLTHGTLYVKADGSTEYQTHLNDTAGDTVTYTISDDALASNTANVNFTITSVNDTPVAVDNNYTATEDVLLTGKNIITDDDNGPAAGGVDHDVDSANLTLASVGGTAFANLGDATGDFAGWKMVALTHGTLYVQADGSTEYQSKPNDSAGDTVAYTISDGALASNTANVNFTVTPANDPPVAVDDTLSGTQNTPLTITSANLFGADGAGPNNDYDIDSASFSSITVTALATNGSLRLNGTAVTLNQVISADAIAAGNLSFVPNTNFYGSAVFKYTVSDGAASSNVANVTINVAGVPSLADRFFINEVGVGVGSVSRTINTDNGTDTVITGPSRIELINNFNNAVSTADLRTVQLEIVNPSGNLDVIRFDQLVGLTVDKDGNPLGGSAISGNGVLVLYEPNGSGLGIWEVYNNNSLGSSGTYQDSQWALGSDVTSPVAVNLVQAGSSLDFFAANGALLSNLTTPEEANPSQTFLTGIGALGSGTHPLGSVSPFLLPDRSSPWFGGAQLNPGSVPQDVADLIAAQNTQFNASLASPDDHVFARDYDRYLTSSKGSSVDNVFIDQNDAGDWSYGPTAMGTFGFKNAVLTANGKLINVANPLDAGDNINPNQGTNQHGDVITSISNEDGQTIAIYSGAGSGGAGQDFVYGVAGADTLHGNGGDDFLYGSGGNDFLFGDSGGDRLNGGNGNDNLNGGTGRDSFVFSTALDGANNVDTIDGFVSGTDKIWLDHAVFATLTAGSMNGGAFVAGASPTETVSTRIVYNTSTGALYYDTDGNGSGAMVQFAVLTGHPTLTAADFLAI
ncbi:MAG: Ig-like domain-containing protein [Rhodocyclaceae bacterium]